MTSEGNLVLTPEDCALLLRVLPIDPSGNVCVPGQRDKYHELRYALACTAQLVPVPLNGDTLWNGAVSWARSIIDDGSAHNQVYTVVRAKSKAEALRMLAAVDGSGESASRFNSHWSKAASRKAASIVTERGVYAEGKNGWVRLYPK